MFMRMGTVPKRVAKYWVDQYNGTLLDRDTLEQEAYIVYLTCQDKWDPQRGKFSTFFSMCLQNRFRNLKKKRKREFDALYVDISGGSWDNYNNDKDTTGILSEIQENLKTEGWITDEQLMWDELIVKVESHLSGMALQVFRVLIEHPLELVNLSTTGNVTWTSVGKYFKVSRNVIKSLDYKIRRAVLLAIDTSPRHIHEILGRQDDW